MKKILMILLALVLVFALAACGETETPSTTPAATTENTPVETTEAVEDTTPVETTEGAVAAAENAASKVLNNIWALYTEDTKFFAMGGDYNAMVDGVAAIYGDQNASL